MNKLKQIRSKQKLTQKQVALRLGISQQAYCEFEKGKSNPSLETAKKISDLFNKSIEEIFFNNKNK